MKGGILLILAIFSLVCSKVGKDSGRSATKFEDALTLNNSESESVVGRKSKSVKLGITGKGNWVKNRPRNINDTYSPIRSQNSDGRAPIRTSQIVSKPFVALKHISNAEATTESSVALEGGIADKVSPVESAVRTGTSSSKRSRETSNTRTNVTKNQVESVLPKFVKNKFKDKATRQPSSKVLHNEEYSVDDRKTMLTKLVGQKYTPDTHKAWSRPASKAELVENLRTMKEPSNTAVTKDQFIDKLEMVEGLSAGHLSKSKAHRDVSKQVEEQKNIEDITSLNGGRTLRTAARLAEKTTPLTKQMKTAIADPTNVPRTSELTGLKKPIDNAPDASLADDKVEKTSILEDFSKTTTSNRPKKETLKMEDQERESNTQQNINDKLTNTSEANKLEENVKVKGEVAKKNYDPVQKERAKVPVDQVEDKSTVTPRKDKLAPSASKEQEETKEVEDKSTVTPREDKLAPSTSKEQDKTIEVEDKSTYTPRKDKLAPSASKEHEETKEDGMKKDTSDVESVWINSEMHKVLTQESNSSTSDASKNDRGIVQDQNTSLAPASETPSKGGNAQNYEAEKVTNITTKVDEEEKPFPVSKAPTKVDEAEKVAVGATKVNESEKVAAGTTIVDKIEKVTNRTTKADAEDQSIPVAKAPNKLDKVENVTENIIKEDEVLPSSSKAPVKPDELEEVGTTSKVGKEAKAVSIPSKVPLNETNSLTYKTQEPTKPKKLLEAVRFEIETRAVLTYGAHGGVLSRMLKIKVTLRDRLPEETNMVKINVIPYQMKRACYSVMVNPANIEKDNNITVFGDLEYRVTLEPLDTAGNQLAKLSGVYLEAESSKWNEKFDNSLFFRTVNLQGLTREWLQSTFAELGKIEPGKLTLIIWINAGEYKTELTVREKRSSMKLEQIRSVLGNRPNVLSKLGTNTPQWDSFLKSMREARDISVYTKRESSAAPVKIEPTFVETPPQKWGAILFIVCLCFITIRTIYNHFKMRGDFMSTSDSAVSGRYKPISVVDDVVDGDSINDVKEFLAEVLSDLKVPQFEHMKYFIALSDLHLWSVKQLQTMDPQDWSKLDIPAIIKDEMRIRLMQINEKPKKSICPLQSPKKKNILDRRLERRRNGAGIEILDASSESENWDVK